MRRLWIAMVTILCAFPTPAAAQAAKQPEAPMVTKVEPPNWWIGLSPDVMVLLSGQHLQATHVSCNLASVTVGRTEASANGEYLLVWMKIGTETQSGTAVCRVETPNGNTTFELPLSERTERPGKFQGLTPNDVVYLIMPDRFANGDASNDDPAGARGMLDRKNERAYHGGDLRGIREHLGYLKELGVTALWLTPVVKNGTKDSYHGYGATDLYAVDPHFGTLRDYQELVSQAHKNGMKIVFDAVPNHVGPAHPWVAKPPLADWFHGTKEKHLDSNARIPGEFYGMQGGRTVTSDPFEALADPHATKQMKRNLTDGWFFGILPDLNTQNKTVEQYLIQNTLWWAESSGLDAFRVDTFPYVDREFWRDWTGALKRAYPRMTEVGEIFHPDPSVTSFFAGGQKRYDGVDSGLGTPFDFPMYFVLRDVLLHGAPVGKITNVLRHDSLYPHPERLVTFFANHDVTRFASEPGSSAAKLKLAFGLVATLRGTPDIYYGDEIGMPGGGDPDNRRDFPGGWTGDAKNAFTREGRTAEQQEIFGYVQMLLAARREHEALRSGALWHLLSDEKSYVFLRETEDERVVVAFNNSGEARDLSVPIADTPAAGSREMKLLLGDAKAEISGGEMRIHAPGQSIAIFLLK